MNLTDIIRYRIIAQQMHLPITRTSVDVLNKVTYQAWWVAGDYGLKARNHSLYRRPSKKLLSEGMIQIFIENTYRITSVPIMIALTTNNISEPIDPGLVKIVRGHKFITKSDLAKELGVTLKELAPRLRREQKRNTIVLYQDQIWYWSDFQQKFPSIMDDVDVLDLDPVDLLEFLIIEVVKRYPLVSIDQLSFLLNTDSQTIFRPLSNLFRKGKINRGITTNDSPDELFSIDPIINENEIDWSNTPVFVLEKRDIIVELIKLERYFEHKNGDFWLFALGLPQAEFKFKSIGKGKHYRVHSFNRFPTTTLDNPQIVKHLQQWAKDNKITLEVSIEDEFDSLARQFITVLRNRGYEIKDDSLLLHKPTEKLIRSSTSEIKSINRKFSWKSLGNWYRSKQYLGNIKAGSAEVLLEQMVQIDELASICYRTGELPSKFTSDELIYTTGLNHRFGYIHPKYLENIILAFPRLSNANFLDTKILDNIGDGKTITELSKGVNRLTSEVQKRILVMERKRLVRRDLSVTLDTDYCDWHQFSKGLKIKKGDGRASQYHLGVIILQILKQHIPLTLIQLARVLGITVSEITEIKDQLLHKGELIEGYYVHEEVDPQLTLPEILDDLNEYEEEEEEVSSSWSDINILPFADPVALVYSISLLQIYPELQPTRRYSHEGEWWFILWKGQPAGYFVKYPTTKQLIDYGISIHLRSDILSNPIIGGLLQEIVNIFKLWYDDEIIIENVNGMKLSEVRFESIHFLLGTLGLEYE